jgi:hypothetical protein
MKLVIIESPFAGDVERNIAYARKALLDSLERGEAPLASHLLYTQVLNDKEPGERKLGIDAGLSWYESADVIAFYEDHGMSPGMNKAFDLAMEMGKEIEIRKIGVS